MPRVSMEEPVETGSYVVYLSDGEERNRFKHLSYKAGESSFELPGSHHLISAKPGERAAFWGVPRAPMTLAISEDGGRTWPYKRNLEVGDGYRMTNNSREQLNREFSYPSIKQGPDGTLHIAFTYFRQAIKYVRVSEDWVRARE